ncbi:hypothetical protein [Billgrantia endophytica]|nr:hypothetical protein [Halomonas endophytica]
MRKILLSAIGVATLSALFTTQVLAQQYYFRYPVYGVSASTDPSNGDTTNPDNPGDSSTDLSLYNIEFTTEEISFTAEADGDVDTTRQFSITLTSDIDEISLPNNDFESSWFDRMWKDFIDIDYSTIYTEGELTILMEAFDTEGNPIYTTQAVDMSDVSFDSFIKSRDDYYGLLVRGNRYSNELYFEPIGENIDTNQPINIEIQTSRDGVINNSGSFDVNGSFYFNENDQLENISVSSSSGYNLHSVGGTNDKGLGVLLDHLALTKDAEYIVINFEAVDTQGDIVTSQGSLLNSTALSNILWYHYYPYPGDSCDTGYTSRNTMINGQIESMCFVDAIDSNTMADQYIDKFNCPTTEYYEYIYVEPENSGVTYSYPSGSKFYDACVLDTYYEEPLENGYVVINNQSFNDNRELSFDYSSRGDIAIDENQPVEISLTTSAGNDSFSEYLDGSSSSVVDYDVSSIYVNGESLEIQISSTDINGNTESRTVFVLMPEIQEAGEIAMIEEFRRVAPTNRFMLTLDSQDVDTSNPVMVTAYFSDYEGAMDVGFSQSQVYFSGDLFFDTMGDIESYTHDNVTIYSNTIEFNAGNIDLISDFSNSDSFDLIIEATDKDGNIIQLTDSVSI